MRGSQLLKMAWRQSVSDLNHIEWRSLLIALCLATTLATFLALLGNQLEKGLGQQSAEILGADLSLSGARPLADPVRSATAQRQIQHTEVVQFSSMLSFQQQMLLSSVRSVSAPYPLRGKIISEPATTLSIPAPGTAWAEPQLLERLGAQVGSEIQLGYASFTITAKMLSSPDRGNGFRSFSPQLLINAEDLAATRVIQPGSRITYRTLFSGSESAIREFEQWLKPQLESQQRLWSIYQDQPMAPGALNNASSFLRLAALCGLLLCGLIISLSLQRYSLSQYSRCALLISLGMPPTRLLKLYFTQLLLGWSLAILPGTLFSIGLVKLAEYLLKALLPVGLPSAEPLYYLTGALLSAALLLIIGFIPLMRMSQVPVMGLLRREPFKQSPLNLGSKMLLGVAIWGVLALYLQSALSALLAITLSTIITLLAGMVATLAITPLVRIFAGYFRLGRLLKFRLRQQRRWHRMQLGIMSLLLALLSTLLISQTELVDRWQNQLPEDTPDQFLINIQPWELQPVTDFLNSRGIDNQLYPMIRGRISHINNQLPAELLNSEQLKHNALNRELNLSWSATAPKHNQLISGQWWSTSADNNLPPLISIEQELAEALGLKLGDSLRFDFAGQSISAVISNIRKVEWRSFKPNFYIIFNPGALQSFPQTYITSFRLPTDQSGFSRALIQQFPALTLIDVTQWIAQAKQLISQLVQASGVILLLTLLAGLFLLQLLLHQELVQRQHENNLLNILGATPAQTRRLDLFEFALLGLLSGVMGAIITEFLVGLINQQLLGLPLLLHPPLWFALPLIGMLIFITAALLRRRKTHTH